MEDFVAADRATLAAVGTLATLVDRRDSGTNHHSNRVAELAEGIALSFGLSYELAQAVYLAGKLHDVGKVAVPDSDLRNPGELTEEERAMVRRHPSIGANVVSHLDELAILAPVIRSHHERYDGNGYPQGLRGEEIPLEARIVAVADAFDAMTNDRPYRRGLTVEEARERLREEAGTQFDPEVVSALDRDPEVVSALDRYLDALMKAVSAERSP